MECLGYREGNHGGVGFCGGTPCHRIGKVLSGLHRRDLLRIGVLLQTRASVEYFDLQGYMF